MTVSSLSIVLNTIVMMVEYPMRLVMDINSVVGVQLSGRGWSCYARWKGRSAGWHSQYSKREDTNTGMKCTVPFSVILSANLCRSSRCKKEEI